MGAIHELAELRNRTAVFRDRTQAGEVLAGMLETLRDRKAIVLAIPAGGVPVAAVVAQRLGWPLAAAVVSKITLPWNSEIGYGAVAFDGSVRLNEDLIAALALSERTIEQGIARTRAKVEERQRRLSGDRPGAAAIARREAVLVDDGAATGFTLLTAAEAVRRYGPERLIVAVPTGPAETIERLARQVDALYCANVRAAGQYFAVADAYEHWHDVDEQTARALLARHRGPQRDDQDGGSGPGARP